MSNTSARKRQVSPKSFPAAQQMGNALDQTQAELDAKESLELLHGQNLVLELIAQGQPLEKTLDTLLRIVEQQSPGMLVSILLLDSDGKHVRHGAAPSLPATYTQAVDGEPIGACAGSCGTAAYRAEPVVVEDIATDPLWAKYKDLALKHHLRACWSTPIFDEQGRVLGTFALYFRQPGRPDTRHLRQIAMVTYTASIAIIKHRQREALALADERLRLALTAAKVGIWERDLRTNRVNWNAQIKRLLGYREDEENLTFERALASVHPDDQLRLTTGIQEAVAKRKEISIEFRVIWPDGSVHWIEAIGKAEYDAYGAPTWLRGVGLDVSERKRIEEELTVRETQLADAQRIANFGSYEWLPTSDTVRWTDELFRIFGFEPGAFQPNLGSYLDHVHPDDRDATRSRIERCVHDGTSFEGEERVVCPDGSTRWLLSQGRWIFDKSRQTRKLVGTCQDITSRKEAERLRARLEDELNQAQKMESIGRLAGGVAHDFNNLLTVIFGHLLLCQDKVPADSPVRGHLQQIQGAANRAAELIRHLLAFSRRQVIQPAVLDLNEVVTNLSKMMLRVIGEHIALRIIPGKGLGSIRADLGQIDQILMNVLVNSVDAMPHGGQILIETSNTELDEHYATSHPAVQPGSYVMLSVSDTGIGMDSCTLARIFEPFFTTKAPGAGTGLGLAMVYGAVEQNHGHIAVFSQPGAGTTFKVYFPCVDQAPEVIHTSVDDSNQTGWETILLVEDDQPVRDLTTALLRERGYRVLTADNGVSALALAQQYSDNIHLLLTDIVMPEMTGPDLASRLKAHRPQLEVLYMSGYAGKLLSNHGVLESEAVLLHKPFTRRSLLKHISSALRKTA